MSTKKGNNRSEDENKRIAAIARAAKAQKQAAANAKKAAKIAKVQAEHRHILTAPAKVIEKPISVIPTKPPASTLSVQPTKKKSNVGPALAARREQYEAKKATTAAKKALEQQIKQANREIREYTARQKKSAARKKVGEQFTFQDVLKGRLPDQYPYFVQVGDEITKNRRARAKKITSDSDVKQLLKKLETKDTRAKLVDIKKPKNISKPRPKQTKAIVEQIAPASLADNIADDDLNDFWNELIGEEGAHEPTPHDVLDSDLDDLSPREREYEDYGYDNDYIDVDSPIGGGYGGSSFGYGGGSCSAMAKSVAENCLLYIIRLLNLDTGKVYERFPHLKPNNMCESIYVTHEELEEISKIVKTNIIVYSALGAKIDEPWHTFKYNNNRTIRIVCENGHAFLMKKKFAINEIIYGPLIKIQNIEGLVVDHGYYRDELPTNMESRAVTHGSQVPMYYVVLHKNRYTMFKEYQPSKFTGNTADDKLESGNTYVFSDDQYLFRKFKKQFELKTIKQQDMREIVKASEHFISREIYTQVTKDMKIIDHNKNYMAYKSCGYYMGFPDNSFAASSKPQLASSPYKDTFVAVKDITNLPRYASRMLRYTSGSIVLTVPVYRYLLDIGVQMTTEYWLASFTKDIDIIEYADTIGITGEKEKKNFRNSLVGRCIAGGIKETKGITIAIGCDREREQILHECDIYDIPVTINGNGSLTVYYKTKTNALYQFHSFILGYAAIHMMKKMKELEDNKCTIAGYNVDSIFYYGDYKSQTGTGVGEWKYEAQEGKTILKHLKKTDITPFSELKIKYPDYMEQFRYIRDTLIIGPPGVGKSHEFRVSCLFDQIILTPTRLLREAYKSGEYAFSNTYTVHKYVQFSFTKEQMKTWRKLGKIPGLHMTVVIDEFTMFNKKQWDIIFDRIRTGKNGKNVRIIVLGDPEQICNNIGGEQTTVQYFKDRGFDVIEHNRTPDSVARHTYEEGCILDTLRGLPEVTKGKGSWQHAKDRNDEQVARLRPHVESVDNIYEMIPSMIRGPCTECIDKELPEHPICCVENRNDIYVSDMHKKLHEVNMAARKWCIDMSLTFPVNDGKGNIIRVSPHDDKIWWGRRRMADVKPDDCKYEPALAVTGDSVQGRTLDCKVYVDTTMIRPKVFYTAVTRTRKLANIILVNSSPIYDPEKNNTEATTDGIKGKQQHPPESYPSNPIPPMDDTCEHTSPIEDEVPREPIIEYSTGPKKLHPRNKYKEPNSYPVSERIKMLKKKVQFLLKGYFKCTNAGDIKTFAEYDCYSKIEAIKQKFIESLEKKPDMFNDPRVIGKTIRDSFAKKYKEINEENKTADTSCPPNILAYRELYRLALKCHRKKEYILSYVYCTPIIYKYLLDAYTRLRAIDPDVIKSIMQAVSVWKNIESTININIDKERENSAKGQLLIELIKRTLGGDKQLFTTAPVLALVNKRSYESGHKYLPNNIECVDIAIRRNPKMPWENEPRCVQNVAIKYMQEQRKCINTWIEHSRTNCCCTEEQVMSYIRGAADRFTSVRRQQLHSNNNNEYDLEKAMREIPYFNSWPASGNMILTGFDTILKKHIGNANRGYYIYRDNKRIPVDTSGNEISIEERRLAQLESVRSFESNFDELII